MVSVQSFDGFKAVPRVFPMRWGVSTDGEGQTCFLWDVTRADVPLLHLPQSPPKSWKRDQFEALDRVLIPSHGQACWEYPGSSIRVKDFQGTEGEKSWRCCLGGGWWRIRARGHLLKFPPPGFKIDLLTSAIGWLSISLDKDDIRTLVILSVVQLVHRHSLGLLPIWFVAFIAGLGCRRSNFVGRRPPLRCAENSSSHVMGLLPRSRCHMHTWWLGSPFTAQSWSNRAKKHQKASTMPIFAALRILSRWASTWLGSRGWLSVWTHTISYNAFSSSQAQHMVRNFVMLGMSSLY